MEDEDVGGGVEGDDLRFELVAEGGPDGEEASDREVVGAGGGGGGVRGHVDDLRSLLLSFPPSRRARGGAAKERSEMCGFGSESEGCWAYLSIRVSLTLRPDWFFWVSKVVPSDHCKQASSSIMVLHMLSSQVHQILPMFVMSPLAIDSTFFPTELPPATAIDSNPPSRQPSDFSNR
ncbi:hypothetical protein NL676_031767 [Syzygium grande]|nr:hypothetical protein NL676_031767 [Syzygium grande]